MNLEREAMRGRLAGLREKERRLQLRIEGNARALRTGLNTAMLADVAELNVPELDEQWDELKGAWAALAVVKSDIARLQRELD